VITRHRKHIDVIAAHLKAKATRQLSIEDIHPMKSHAGKDGRLPSPWARNYWCPFIATEDYMRKAIRYVQRNPLKMGLAAQHWNCVVPYEAPRIRREK
jgi:hypothetical protein